jgi:hypothetical protein
MGTVKTATIGGYWVKLERVKSTCHAKILSGSEVVMVASLRYLSVTAAAQEICIVFSI